MKPRVVSLCTGYGGLELALTEAGIDHELVAVADMDPAASKVLAARFPGVPNLGDISVVDWATLGPVHILTAGYPCQGFSLAGQRKGTDDERFIWPAVADAVRVLRPRAALLENVAGHRSLGFGRVLGDLAAVGYDAGWVSVRASDVGAAHKRERVFILAHPAGEAGLLPTPRASDTNGAGNHGTGGLDLRTAVAGLLPTPRASANENRQGKRTPTQEAGTHGRSLAAEICTLFPTPTKLLPTPTAVHHARNATATRAAPKPTTCTTSWTLADVAHADRWGAYALAVAHWEAILGRPAPEPTEPGRDGKARLAPQFTEWLMGLPGGWVCGVPGLSRNDMLRLLGNGVVYQQAAHALHLLAGAR